MTIFKIDGKEYQFCFDEFNNQFNVYKNTNGKMVKEVEEKIKKIMMTIPNIIDPSVPIGKDDSENVELERFGEPVVPDFEIPYHTEIMEAFNGIDLDSARKVAGNGFYYLMEI